MIHATQEYNELYHKFLQIIHDTNRVTDMHWQWIYEPYTPRALHFLRYPDILSARMQ